jgi:hypothetical protein
MTKKKKKKHKKRIKEESHSSLVGERSQLLSQLLLQELNPVFLSRPTAPEVGYDFIVGFANAKAGTNTFAVQVKAVEQPPSLDFPIAKRDFNRFAHSNIPGLLLVVDTKFNHLYYAWLTPKTASGDRESLSVPLVEINDETKRDLVAQVRKSIGPLSVAG